MNTGNLTASSANRTHIAHGSLIESESFAEIQKSGIVSQDAVATSHDTLLINEAFHVAQNTPDLRLEKVEALKLQVMNNIYNVDTHKLAEALLREAPSLFEL